MLAHRLRNLVREQRERSFGLPPDDLDPNSPEYDVMTLLVELRTAAKRGSEPPSARRLGPEFTRYLGEFYKLPSEAQTTALEALLKSLAQRDDGDLGDAVQTCEAALTSCPGFPPLLERLAMFEAARGNPSTAERWYGQLLVELDRRDLAPRALEICRRLVEQEPNDPDLLLVCAQILEHGDERKLASDFWAKRAAQFAAAGRPAEALSELDRALNLQPTNAHLNLELALVYDALGEVDRMMLAFQQAEALAGDDADTLARVLLIRSRNGRPDEQTLGRLMDLLASQPNARTIALQRCEEAVADQPYNPHLRYVHGVLLAQNGDLDEGIACLKLAVERFIIQSDRDSELEARLVLQELLPRDTENHRRVAAIYFERGEVQLAMKALAGLARVARGQA